jgi:hypothetical protein
LHQEAAAAAAAAAAAEVGGRDLLKACVNTPNYTVSTTEHFFKKMHCPFSTLAF